jgi:flagellar P-ring protein precursor FlgI
VSTGTRIDVSVSSLGDATSLAGGMLVMTPLLAADGEAYAVAQGPLTVGGIAAKGDAQSVQQGVPTSGRIVNGAIVEQNNTANINTVPKFTLRLHNPDFGTVARMADAINSFARTRYGMAIASEHDDRTIDVSRPEKVAASRMLAEIGDVRVDVDTAARIVIDEKNGTIVMGANVRVLPVAVSHGNLVVKITEMPVASQPNPLSDGETVVLPTTDISVEQTGGPFAMLRGPSLENLVAGLNKMGLRPADIVSILQTIKAAGALQAELVVQ